MSPPEPPVIAQLLRAATKGTYPKYQQFPEDEDRDAPRNFGLSIRPTWAAASRSMFHRTVIKYVKSRRAMLKFLRFSLLIHEVSRSHTTMHHSR